MAEDPMNDLFERSLGRALDRALETAPRPQIPVGFAARVARQLPPRNMVVVSRARYSQAAGMACLLVLLSLMFAFAHRATGASVYWLVMETILCAQFALLAVWLVASANS